MAAVMALSAWEVARGTHTIGDFVFVNAMLMQLSVPLNFIGFIYREIRQALTDIEQMFDLLDGLWDERDAWADVAQKTKRLARKQMGWFGRDPRIHWLQALNPALVDNAMAIIAHSDNGDYDAIDAQADAYVQHHLGDIG